MPGLEVGHITFVYISLCWTQWHGHTYLYGSLRHVVNVRPRKKIKTYISWKLCHKEIKGSPDFQTPHHIYVSVHYYWILLFNTCICRIYSFLFKSFHWYFLYVWMNLSRSRHVGTIWEVGHEARGYAKRPGARRFRRQQQAKRDQAGRYFTSQYWRQEGWGMLIKLASLQDLSSKQPLPVKELWGFPGGKHVAGERLQ